MFTRHAAEQPRTRLQTNQRTAKRPTQAKQPAKQPSYAPTIQPTNSLLTRCPLPKTSPAPPAPCPRPRPCPPCLLRYKRAGRVRAGGAETTTTEGTRTMRSPTMTITDGLTGRLLDRGGDGATDEQARMPTAKPTATTPLPTITPLETILGEASTSTSTTTRKTFGETAPRSVRRRPRRRQLPPQPPLVSNSPSAPPHRRARLPVEIPAPRWRIAHAHPRLWRELGRVPPALRFRRLLG